MPIKRRALKRLKTKKKCEELHAQKRCRQRFNIELTSREIKDIANHVGCKNDKFVKRLSLRVTAWETTIQGEKVIFLYDSKRHMIVTFLPLDYKLRGTCH